MSKALEEQKNVYNFLQKSLDRDQIILNRMVEIEKNVNETAAEIKVLAKQINDENRLLPAEVDDLFNAVVAKSIELAKVRNEEGTDDFKKIVGKYRRLIWSKLKKRNGTSKYIHTKRIDFEPSLEFVRTFNPEDYI